MAEHAVETSTRRRPALPAALRALVSRDAVGLPPRYAERWRDAFDERVRPALVPGVKILDVGSGCRPTIPPEERPPGCFYAGLDLSLAELQRAPPGSYDEMQVADVARHLPELDGRFDLVVSWQVLEHVKPLAVAMDNLRVYLRPGGQLVAQMSGRFSSFGVINLLVPQRLGVWAMQRLLGRDPATVFPAYYDRCWDGALQRLFAPWCQSDVTPRYAGARYFSFIPVLQRAYLSYEDWVLRTHRRNLATHYLVVAVR